MTVRAKFKVQKIEQQSQLKGIGPDAAGNPRYERVELRTIVLQPVYSADTNSENRKFWEASPSGEIRLGTISEQAWSQFELDGEYYIDFTPAK